MTQEAKIYTHDERLHISNNMLNYGGSFARSIGQALLVADLLNTRRIEVAFPELLAKYSAEHWK